MSLDISRSKPSVFEVKGSIEQNELQYLAIDIPVGTLQTGDLRVSPIGHSLVLANEVMIHARVSGSRKRILFGEKVHTLRLNIKAHRFSRIGTYVFSLEVKDSKGQRVELVFTVNVAAGSEYQPKALIRPAKKLLTQAEKLKPAFVGKGERDNATPVIMAAWRRVDSLQRTINDLKRQTRKSRLIIWLNDPNLLPETLAVVEKEKALHITVYSSPNIGGFGRFYAGKKEGGEVMVLLDDDQRLAEDSIEKLMGVYSPNSIVGQWSFRFYHPRNYWLKDKPPRGVVEADYIGTGGMVMDARVLRDKRLYEDIPDEYWFIEDLWLSWFAEKYYGYRLYSLDAGIKIIKDDKDQMSSLVDRKSEFYQYLTKKGARWSNRMKRLEKYDALTK